MYKSSKKLFEHWPMSQYTEAELEILQKIAVANKEDFCVRIYGYEYVHFYKNGEMCPFEHEEFDEKGKRKGPPTNDKWVFYIFGFVPLKNNLMY